MATATVPTKSVRLPALKSTADLDHALASAGSVMHEISRIQTLIAEEEARVRERFAEMLEEQKKLLEKETNRIFKYTTEHRAELLGDTDSKTIELGSGTLRFYFGGVAVVTEDDDPVIEHLKKKGPAEALRVTVELDREYIEKHRDELDLPDISFEQTENLAILPTGVDEKKTIRRKVRTLVLD